MSFDPATHSIEQRNTKLSLEGLDLARSGRLAQAQTFTSGGKASSFRDDDERL
jgi:hypothetical protein